MTSVLGKDGEEQQRLVERNVNLADRRECAKLEDSLTEPEDRTDQEDLVDPEDRTDQEGLVDQKDLVEQGRAM